MVQASQAGGRKTLVLGLLTRISDSNAAAACPAAHKSAKMTKLAKTAKYIYILVKTRAAVDPRNQYTINEIVVS